MIYRILADLILIVHFCFVLFAIFGGFLVLRRRWILWLHFPALFWSVLVEIFNFICPLTYIENFLRASGGEAGYSGGFIEYYIRLILYLDISQFSKFLLAFLLLITNLIIYSYVFLNKRIPKLY